MTLASNVAAAAKEGGCWTRAQAGERGRKGRPSQDRGRGWRLLNFLIVAFVIFLLVRTLNNMQKRLAREAKVAPPPEAPVDIQLLTEIRDLLKNNLQDGRLPAGPRTVTPER